jgi:hypothetical protein
LEPDDPNVVADALDLPVVVFDVVFDLNLDLDLDDLGLNILNGLQLAYDNADSRALPM